MAGTLLHNSRREGCAGVSFEGVSMWRNLGIRIRKHLVHRWRQFLSAAEEKYRGRKQLTSLRPQSSAKRHLIARGVVWI